MVQAAPSSTLLSRYPGLALPRVALGRWPTPVTELGELASELGVGSLHVKRDDQSAALYGGGKPRKLEWLLGDAVDRGAREVVTFGGVGSHHALATALYARQLGLEATLLLLPQPPSAEVRQVLLISQGAGARMVLVGTMREAERQAALRVERDAGVVILPVGGTSPLGNVGFVDAAFELAAQVKAGQLPEPDELYIAMGTMGSAVGLAIGLEAVGLKTTVVAVRASNRPTSSWSKIARLHADTVAFLRRRDLSFPEMELDRARLRVEDRFLGKGYAQPTAAGRAATELAARHGITLDATYSAKAFAALLAGARSQPSKHVVFWHTHGALGAEATEGTIAALPKALRSYAR